MNRVKNATQFVGLLRTALHDYEGQYRARIAAIRAHFTNTPIPPDTDDALEAHKRVYIINRFLEALNWQYLTGRTKPFSFPKPLSDHSKS